MHRASIKPVAMRAVLFVCCAALSACGSTKVLDSADGPKVQIANCDAATIVPRIASLHMLPIRATDAVVCDGGLEIRVPHPRAFVQILNRATPWTNSSAYYCPLDDGNRISIVVTGISISTGKPDGRIITLHTSGCREAETISGTWRLSTQAWAAIRKLDPSLNLDVLTKAASHASPPRSAA